VVFLSDEKDGFVETGDKSFLKKYIPILSTLVLVLCVILAGCHRKSQQPSTTPASVLPNSALSRGSAATTKNIVANIPGRKTFKPGGLSGEYFQWKGNNNFFAGQPVFTRVDNEISFDWETYPPDSRLTQDHFSIRWTGYLMVDKEDDYKIRLDADDGAQLTIDEKQVLPMGLFSRKEIVHLTQGFHKILLEYYQQDGVALCYLFWSEPPYRETCIIPSDHLYYDETSYQP
jgi:preprotein translocase subunit SecG